MALSPNNAASGERVDRLLTPLPDPLVRPGRDRIRSKEEWSREQRAHVVELFETHVYGRAPVQQPDDLKFTLLDERASAFNALARRRIVRISYAGPAGSSHFDVTIHTPTFADAKGCFIHIVNHERSIIDQAERTPTEFWPIETIVARGYAAIAFHYADLAQDRNDTCFQSGVFAAYGPTTRRSDSWGALSAWAWGASRVIDYLATNPELCNKPIAVVGHSRGGKAALWCGALDSRVALTISNNSGAAGAALARRTRGETVEAITRVFPYWFAENYRMFADNEPALPVDQHMLLALAAPRLVYVASAREDAWADPSAEFAACVAAAPVFGLFGFRGVGSSEPPDGDTPLHDGAIGYHVRPGGHDLRRHDWNLFMDFADRHWQAHP